MVLGGFKWFHVLVTTVFFLFARTQLKYEGFFAANRKYFVCFSKFYTGKGLCDIFLSK